MEVRYLPCGDAAISVEFGDAVGRAVSQRVVALRKTVIDARLPGVIEAVSTIRSLMVHYDPIITSNARLQEALETLEVSAAGMVVEGQRHRIPVCYEEGYAGDMEAVCRATGLAREQVVAYHSGVEYYVYMIGFAPGQPYMGETPEPIRLPRKASPTPLVPKGSVVIATSQSCLYPMDNPTGWHVIGRTPFSIFDPGAERPVLLAAGDTVVHVPVSSATYEALKAGIERGEKQENLDF